MNNQVSQQFELSARASYFIEVANDTIVFTCIGYKDDGLLFTAYDYVHDSCYDMLISFTNDNKIEYCNRNDEIFNQYIRCEVYQ